MNDPPIHMLLHTLYRDRAWINLIVIEDSIDREINNLNERPHRTLI
jgi:hypothetical protein